MDGVAGDFKYLWLPQVDKRVTARMSGGAAAVASSEGRLCGLKFIIGGFR